MFNRSPFNREYFNRPSSSELLATAILSGTGSALATARMEATIKAALSASGSVASSRLINEYALSGAQMSGQGALTITKMVREINEQAGLSGSGTLTASASRYQVRQIAFTGSLAPGQQLVIDAKRLTATLNGANALHLIEGDFYNLTPGANKLVYADSAGSRQLRFRISHRDRYI